MPQLGVTIRATTSRRFWMMVAHHHGQIWNSSEFAAHSALPTRRYATTLTCSPIHSLFVNCPPGTKTFGRELCFRALERVSMDPHAGHSEKSEEETGPIPHNKLRGEWSFRGELNAQLSEPVRSLWQAPAPFGACGTLDHRGSYRTWAGEDTAPLDRAIRPLSRASRGP